MFDIVCQTVLCRYDPKSNKWHQVSSMTTPRLGVGVASLGGYLYAVGGSDGDTPLASAERWVRAMHAMAYIVAALVYIHTYMHTYIQI